MSNQQFDMRSTLNLLNSVAQGRRILNEGRVGQIADDLESLSDAEFFKEYGKTKAEKRKEFDGDKASAVKEGISNGDQDPNLHKAYNMGHKAYQAYKDDPEAAQAVQDKIEAEFPQYLKMWTTGYRDGERFDKQGVSEGRGGYDVERLAEGALDAAARYIQDELGIESGDNAGMFFQGETYDTIIRILANYTQDEIDNQDES